MSSLNIAAPFAPVTPLTDGWSFPAAKHWIVMVCHNTPWGTTLHVWDSLAEQAQHARNLNIVMENALAELTYLSVNGARGSEGG